MTLGRARAALLAAWNQTSLVRSASKLAPLAAVAAPGTLVVESLGFSHRVQLHVLRTYTMITVATGNCWKLPTCSDVDL